MFLFLISFLIIFISSYLLASLFDTKNYLTGIIYTFLIAFAQIIFTIEFLSLFSAISKFGILTINSAILAITSVIWIKKGKPLYRPQFKLNLEKIFKAFKKDKMLFVMAIGLIIFVLTSLFLCAISPIMAYDSLAYHINRALVWASQGSLAHFDIADVRNINMAINSEILYTWLFTFIPKNMFIGFFALAGYILAACSLYSFLEINGFSMRKRLWTIFLMSSLAGVVIEASGAETNTTVGGLCLAGVSLFLIGLRKNALSPIYFSSLAISIAIGIKTSAFFMIPAIAMIFIYFLLKYQKTKFWYYTGIFIGFALINFLVFSAYNYILNYLDFGNFIANESSQAYHSMKGGLKGFISGLIHHLVLLFDFTGFTYGAYLQNFVFKLQDNILTSLNIPLDLNVITTNNNYLNYMLNDARVGGGVIGIFVFVPCAIIAIIKGLFWNKPDKNKILGFLGLSLFLSIVVMSLCIGFMLYSARFLVSFFILASPVLVLSYIKSNKNIFKYIILFWVMSYLVLVSTHLWQRHFVNITKQLATGTSLREIRTKNLCSLNHHYSGKMPYCDLRSFLYKAGTNTKIGIFPSIASDVAVIKFMEADGYKVDYLMTEKIDEYDLTSYDYIIHIGHTQDSSYYKNVQKILENYKIKDNQLFFINENQPLCVLMKNEKELITQENLGKAPIDFVRCMTPYEQLKKAGLKLHTQIVFGEFGENSEKQNVNGVFIIFKR